MSNHCKICGNGHNNKFHIIKEMMFGTQDVFDYLECKRCGTIQLLNPPDDLSTYYPADYYAYTPLNESGILRKILKRMRWKLYTYIDIKPFSPLYGDWLKKAGVKTNDRIADIGCGNGQLLYEMYASGFINLVGIDPYIEKTHILNPSLTLLKKSIFDTEGTFDFIMMHHSYEHMEDPKAVLEKTYQLLKPGKKALIRIPVSDGEAWKKYGVYWAQLDAPRHFFIHSITSIQLLAEQTGFKVSKIEFDSNGYQFWASEAISQGIPSTKAGGIFSRKQLHLYDKQAEKLNRINKGDQACFYLTRE
jgi:SAM-dependent methyltransferase